MNTFINVLWQHLLASVLQNWGTTVNGLIGAAIAVIPTLWATYGQGQSFTSTNWTLIGLGIWYAVWNALRAKFSWQEVFGALFSSTPKAQLVDMTKQNTGATIKP